LAEAGADVIIGDIDLAGADEVASEISTTTRQRAIATHLDVTDTATLAAAANLAVGRLGGLEIWVNSAGTLARTGPVTEATDASIDRILEINVRGTFAGAREAARQMLNGGVIINLASTNGFRASPDLSAYVASKHAVVGLTKALALELGPLGIRVLGIAPALIDTPGIRDIRREAQSSAGAGIDVANRAAASSLVGAGVPDDVARVALFCASDLSAYMTGSTLLVDAGRLAS
jgi:NAD(P)-dependent dehydrogenase (short-subunit alcohol dehydrogenase family)